MRTFHRVEEREAALRSAAVTNERLSPGLSIIVITGLSAFSWVVLASIVMAFRAVL
jgi:hypothetical protein